MTTSTEDELLWQAAEVEADIIASGAQEHDIAGIFAALRKVLEGQRTDVVMMALCTSLVAILPEKDIALRMNAVTVLLTRCIQGRVDMMERATRAN